MAMSSRLFPWCLVLISESWLAIHRYSIVARRGTRYHWFISGYHIALIRHGSFLGHPASCFFFYESSFPSLSKECDFCRMVMLLDPLLQRRPVSSDSETDPIMMCYQVAPKTGRRPAVAIPASSASLRVTTQDSLTVRHSLKEILFNVLDFVLGMDHLPSAVPWNIALSLITNLAALKGMEAP